MIISLPANLESAIAEALRALPSSQWVAAARQLSERYRSERPTDTRRSLARGDVMGLGYAGMIMPAAYAQLSGAMRATAERVPAWRPLSMLDIGSGPGTALWAAVEQWPSLQSLTAWEREPAFISLGKRLAAQSSNLAVTGARWEQVTLGGTLPPGADKYDMIVLGHVLNELGESLRRMVVEMAWERCAGVLLIVEPGTSAAFPGVRAAREQLLALGAKTLAPCAHDERCPLVGDWCHFPQKLHRPAFQRRAKEGTAGWEESKFSYSAMSRFALEVPVWGRLIHQPQVGKAGVELTVSSRDGIIKPHASKHDRPRFREWSDLRWGDALAAPPATGQPEEQNGVEQA